MTRRRRYAILGSGALGGLYGGMLARQGHEVHFLLHSDYQHVVEHGLRVDSTWGSFQLPDVHAHRSSKTIPPCDVTIVGLKTTNNHLLPHLLPAPTRGGGIVLVLQNGLDVEQDAANIVGSHRVMGGCCFLCSNKVGPGHIHHLDYGQIVFGTLTPGNDTISPTISQVHDDLSSAGIDVKTTDDLQMIRWRKLMWNIPFNGLSVVLDASTKELVEHEQSLALSQSIVQEVHTTAASCGIQIPVEMVKKTIDNTRTMVPYDSSMRLDFLNKRPMEVESIFGNPIRAAFAQGVRMPLVNMLYQQLKFIDTQNRREQAEVAS